MLQRSGKKILVYAITLGLLAAGTATWYMNNVEASINPTEPVVVAKTYIPARTVLSEDLVTVKNMPKGAVLPESSSTLEPLIGKTTKQSIAPKEQVLASKIFRERAESGLAFVLPEGHRAVAINVNERSAAGGLIVPGDKVDVIGACIVLVNNKDQNRNVAKSVYPIQGIEVLAVAQDVEGEESGSAINALQAKNPTNALATTTRDSKSKPIAKTVTLSLSPEEAQMLVMYENHPSCDIRLALRAPGDEKAVSTSVAEFDPAANMGAVAPAKQQGGANPGNNSQAPASPATAQTAQPPAPTPAPNNNAPKPQP